MEWVARFGGVRGDPGEQPRMTEPSPFGAELGKDAGVARFAEAPGLERPLQRAENAQGRRRAALIREMRPTLLCQKDASIVLTGEGCSSVS